MRILFACKGQMHSAGLRNLSFDMRFYNGLVRGGHAVMPLYCAHEMKKGNPFGLKHIAEKAVEKALFSMAAVVEPEALILSHTSIITPDALRRFRERYKNVRMAYLSVDPLFAPVNKKHLLTYRAVVDAVFVTTGGAILKTFTTETCPFYFMPNVVDGSIDTGRAFENVKPAWDVSCFMNLDHKSGGEAQERVVLARGLKTTLPHLKTFYAGFDGNPALGGLAMLQTYAHSAMALNLSRRTLYGAAGEGDALYLYSSDRIAHITGNGALALIQKGFALDKLYSEEEAVYFKTLEDLIEQVERLHQEPARRMALAQRGWEKAHRAFNERVVMAYILECLFEKAPTPVAWPV